MILVTGASGTVGSQVVRALLERGAPFRAAYRTRPQNLPAHVEAVSLDFDQPDTLPPALRGVSTVFVLSSTVAPEVNLVRAAEEAGVERVVKLSVWGADKEEFTFARWHRSVEKVIEASGLRWTHLRPNSFMQNMVTYMGDTIRGQGSIYTSAPDARVRHVDARDIGAVAGRVLTESAHEGKAYELGGPEALTYREAAGILARVLGREITVVGLTDEAYKQGAVASGMPEAYADALVDLERYYRTGMAGGEAPAVRQLLGREPGSFEQFARDYAGALR
jgi:uncharacterized protein YbjT (DUF2867 family)